MFGVKSARIAAVFVFFVVASAVRAETWQQRHYAGVINGELGVVFSLSTSEKGEVDGEYRYTKYNNMLRLSGKRVKNEITLSEGTRSESVTGTLTLTETKAGGLSGFWKSADGKKAYAVELRKTGETVMLSASREKVFNVRRSYVKLDGKSDFYAALNAKFAGEAEKEIAESSAELQKLRADASELQAAEGAYESLRYAILLYAGESLVSIRYEYYDYAGGAHGNLGFGVCNYAWRDGKVVTLSAKDVLPLTEAGAKSFKAMVVKKLTAEGANWPQDIKIDATENLREVNFTAGGIVLTISPYEASSWAEGPYTVGFSWGELKGLIGEKSVLKGLMK